MKFVNLKIMSIPRLRAYRKRLYARIGAYEHCSCGDSSCDFERFANQDNEHYKKLLIERERVNKELARKQKKVIEAEKNPAHVATIREQNSWIGKPSWYNISKENYYRHRAARRKVREQEEARGPGRTVTWHFEQTGFNAHVADGKFTYDTPALAKKAAKSMKKQAGFSNVKIV